MDKLLQDAIADAKAVRETALANAKLALEEAFTPHLKSMLSKKLQAETEGEDEESHDEGVEVEETVEESEEESKDESVEETNEESVEEAMEDEDEEKKDEVYNDEEMEDEDMNDEEMEDEGHHEGMHDEEMEDDEDDDIGEVLKQLEAEMADEEEDEPKEEGYHDDEEDKEEKEEGAHMDDEDEDMDEEIDLDEIIKALTEEDEEDEEEEKAEEAMVPAAELEEYRQTVQYLKDKLSEVNLLNAKLLYTNKLFRSRNVSEEQKMKVIEQFDRAANVREVKLVFTTFAESIARKPVNESAKRVSKASKPVASTESKKPIIGENTDFKSRMKKLANII